MSSGGDFVAALGPSWEPHLPAPLAGRRPRALHRSQRSPRSPPRAAATRSTRCSTWRSRPTSRLPVRHPDHERRRRRRRPAAAPSGGRRRALRRRRPRRHARRPGLHDHAAGALGARRSACCRSRRRCAWSPPCRPRCTACTIAAGCARRMAADVVLFDPARTRPAAHRAGARSARRRGAPDPAPDRHRARARQRRAAGRARTRRPTRAAAACCAAPSARRASP